MSQNQDDEPEQTVARSGAQKAQRDALKVELEDIAWLMAQARGRRHLWRQLSKAGVFWSSFNTNAMQMARSEGRREQGLDLLALIQQAAPEHYLTMITENTHA